jgi:predicted nucleic acid-binding protein
LKLTPGVAEQARRDHFAFTITRHDLEPLAERIWLLRSQFITCDAAYIALAEALAAPLYTCDTTLAARGHAANVRVLSRRP